MTNYIILQITYFLFKNKVKMQRFVAEKYIIL